MANKTPKPVQSKSIMPVEDDHDSIPPEMAEVLNDLPEPQRKEMSRMITASFGMISRTSPEGEIAKKITPDHISSMLNAQEKSMDYAYRENQHRMIFFVVILAIVITAIIVIIILLKDNNSEAMTQILTALISAALGAAGGYGIGVKRRNDDQ